MGPLHRKERSLFYIVIPQVPAGVVILFADEETEAGEYLPCLLLTLILEHLWVSLLSASQPICHSVHSLKIKY